MKSIDKLRAKLSELFQLDQADLDFGIYRIMNAKRDEITRFLDKDLLPQVEAAFREYKSSDRAEIKKELDKVIESVKAAGVDPEQAPKVKELRWRLADEAVDVSALENEVYDHLHNFFSRYYDEGDFISQRRYKEGVYAIPYEGEEVKLYWANNDQYYIKTSEYFRNYAFRLPDGRRVHFKIVEVDTEKDNIKATNGKECRFFLSGEKPVFEENKELIIRFEYKPDSEKRKQDDLNAEAVKVIMAAKRHVAWQKALSDKWQRADGTISEKTILEKHLYDHTRRNTFDYFIHKDLGRFLRRELDFYIKNEVMHLDDVENESTPRVEQYLSKIKVIRRIAYKIIDFLAQIEDFQKKLWLKKKFVVETNYCVTLDRVPKELYPDIAKNSAQCKEWVRLFAIDEIKGDLHTPKYSEPLSEKFLEVNRYLVVDTKFFDQQFKGRLLASIDNVDEQTDGVLFHGDNFHALGLMGPGQKKKIQCMHIDPPYNTQTSGFLYKNNYQHSSWLSMMADRVSASISLLAKDGSFQSHIDENEYEVLHQLFELAGVPNAGTLVWDKRNPMNAGRGLATQHEYIIWRSGQKTPIFLRNKNIPEMLRIASEIIKKYGQVSKQAQREYADWVDRNSRLSGGEKAYRFMDEQGRIYRGVSLRAPEPRTDPKFHKPLIHPLTGKSCAIPPNGFSRTPETLQNMIDKGEIIFGPDETTQPQQKRFLTEESKRQMSSVIQDARKGKADLDPLKLDFPYCHPVSLYQELIGAAAQAPNDIVLDYFAGSGTTAHAVINLNRDDNVKRKYVLVEIGDYINTVIKPRIQKVVYSKDWKDGKPTSRNSGVGHMFKYIRLESYEDALANLRLKRTEPQQRLIDKSDKFRESYMLQYMLDSETKGSPSLLDIDRFDDPFSYQLLIGTGSVGEMKPLIVDLVETFNWLLGLKVKHMDCIEGFLIVEGTNPKDEKVLVIWRKIRDLAETDLKKIEKQKEKANDALETFFRKQQYNTMDMEFDVIYVNGDNNLMNRPMAPEGENLVPRYKARLIEEEFMRLMFDVTDV